MTQTFYRPSSVFIEKHTFRPQREEHSQYGLYLTPAPDASEEYLVGVHLSDEVRQALAVGGVQALCIERLPLNGLAMHLLPLQPDHIVTGVALADDTTVRSIPPVLLAARRRLFEQAVGGGLAGVALLASHTSLTVALLGAIAALYSLYCARTAVSLPTLPAEQALLEASKAGTFGAHCRGARASKVPSFRPSPAVRNR